MYVISELKLILFFHRFALFACVFYEMAKEERLKSKREKKNKR
jgi:hypothetical protein